MTSENVESQRTSLPMLRSQGSSVGQEISSRANLPTNLSSPATRRCLFWLFLCYLSNVLVTTGAQALSPLLGGTKFKYTDFRSSCGRRALSEQLTPALRWTETRRRDQTQVRRESLGHDLGLRRLNQVTRHRADVFSLPCKINAVLSA